MASDERDILEALAKLLAKASEGDKLYILGIAKGMAAKAELEDKKAG